MAQATDLGSFRRKQLLLSRLDAPDAIHVYGAECVAGERLRVQLLVPDLPLGRHVTPVFAVVAQSLPYSADVQKLPVSLPVGYNAVVAAQPESLGAPVRDILTGVHFYPGPVIDTRTLVSGRCYIVVWSPSHHMGKYGLLVGQRWPWRWTYWFGLPRYWWQIRGWFGSSRLVAYLAGSILLIAAAVYLKQRSRGRGSRAL